jgi:hypothetical protein
VANFRAEFQRRGVEIVVISFAEPRQLVRYQEQHRWPFAILADPKREAYRAFSLQRLSWFRVYSPATLKLYLKLFLQRRVRAHFGREDIYQGGGDFLLDRSGSILFAHRSEQPADRPAATRLLEEIDRASAG